MVSAMYMYLERHGISGNSISLGISFHCMELPATACHSNYCLVIMRRVGRSLVYMHSSVIQNNATFVHTMLCMQ